MGGSGPHNYNHNKVSRPALTSSRIKWCMVLREVEPHKNSYKHCSGCKIRTILVRKILSFQRRRIKKRQWSNWEIVTALKPMNGLDDGAYDVSAACDPKFNPDNVWLSGNGGASMMWYDDQWWIIYGVGSVKDSIARKIILHEIQCDPEELAKRVKVYNEYKSEVAQKFAKWVAGSAK